MKTKPLKYTEYKINQGLWLQRKDSERTDMGTNTEQYCIKCYRSYLILCGYYTRSIDLKINSYLNEIGTYHIRTGNEFYNKGYFEETAKNINTLMDKIL